MLTFLSIHNFTLIESIDLEVAPKLTVITGETGAGKSIVIGALELLMGKRSPSKCVRQGASQADILAVFDITGNEEIKQWLSEHALLPASNEGELDGEEGVILRRVISQEGRSRCFINGRPTTLSDLKQASEKVLSIHGQHQNQLLLKKEYQLDLLDQFADTEGLQRDVSQTYTKKLALRKKLDANQAALEHAQAKQELLTYQVNELQALELEDDEYDQLEQSHKRLAKSDQIFMATNQVLQQLSNENEANVGNALSRLQATLQSIDLNDTSLQEIHEMLNNAEILISEAADSLQRYIDNIEVDPGKLNSIEQRLSTLHQMARKHNINPRELPAHLEQLNEELSSIQRSSESTEQIQQAITQLDEQLLALSSQLTQKRTTALPKLEAAVTAQIKQLGLPKAQFSIKLSPLSIPNAHGQEQIEFMVCTNPGQPENPLREAASGGELSRISLAIQVICSTKEMRPPTMIFDEVDVGVGGAVAESVGQLLRQLGEQGQLLCITHLPQVASQGHHHIHVNKVQETSRTYTEISTLNTDQKVLEIARMLGGIEISDSTVAHAKEMIDRGNASEE